MNITSRGEKNQSLSCETGVRKLLLRIDRATQSDSVPDTEAQLGQLLVHTGLLSETALAACLTYATNLERKNKNQHRFQ